MNKYFGIYGYQGGTFRSPKPFFFYSAVYINAGAWCSFSKVSFSLLDLFSELVSSPVFVFFSSLASSWSLTPLSYPPTHLAFHFNLRLAEPVAAKFSSFSVMMSSSSSPLPAPSLLLLGPSGWRALTCSLPSAGPGKTGLGRLLFNEGPQTREWSANKKYGWTDTNCGSRRGFGSTVAVTATRAHGTCFRGCASLVEMVAFSFRRSMCSEKTPPGEAAWVLLQGQVQA